MKTYSFLQESILPQIFHKIGMKSIRYTYLVFRVISGPIKNLKKVITNSESPYEVNQYLGEFNREIEYNCINGKDCVSQVCIQVGNSITSNIQLQLNSPTWKIDSLKTLDDGYIKLLVSHTMTAGGLTATGMTINGDQ